MPFQTADSKERRYEWKWSLCLLLFFFCSFVLVFFSFLNLLLLFFFVYFLQRPTLVHFVEHCNRNQVAAWLALDVFELFLFSAYYCSLNFFHNKNRSFLLLLPLQLLLCKVWNEVLMWERNCACAPPHLVALLIYKETNIQI